MKIIYKALSEIRPYENNPRNNEAAVKYVKASIEEFGFRVPIVIDKKNVIVAGHTRYKAAEELGLEKVPCIVADDLTPKQIQAFRLVDNKTAEIATWDLELLSEELSIIDKSIDMQEFGFLPSSYQKIEKMFDKEKEAVKSTDSSQNDKNGDFEGDFDYDEEFTGEESEKPKTTYICPCCGKTFEVTA